jgi:alpha-glucosidase
MAIGLALCGVSNSGHDVGGFAGPAPSPELLVRWVQAGVLMPRFSIHSWNDDGTVNEPWMYREAIPAIHGLMALRQQLIPFFYDLLHRYHAGYEPMVRPTWLDFPEDPVAWQECDEHLLGPDLLVVSVMEPGATTREVRPPAGANWINVWSGERLQGGMPAVLDAPLEGPPPLLARAGSAMFVDLAKGGWRADPLQRGVWLFPPEEGAFTWSAVEDAGDGPTGPAVRPDALDRWRVAVRADAEKIVVEVDHDLSGSGVERTLTLLLPPQEVRSLTVIGRAAGRVVVDRGRRGLEVAL